MAIQKSNLPAEVKQTLSILPELSGSYQYFDKNGEIIYVGKAKNLKKRVFSYFNKHHDSPKLRVMVPQIAKIQFIVTDNEVEALILESHLIKKHKPKYNVLLNQTVQNTKIQRPPLSLLSYRTLHGTVSETYFAR